MISARLGVRVLLAIGAIVLGYGTSIILAGSAGTRTTPDNPSALHISNGLIHIDLVSKPPAVSQDQLLLWIRTAGDAVSRYYGRFPVKEVTLHVQVNAEAHEIHGRTYDGQRIEIGFGADVTAADLTDDWTLAHEMFHLASPDLGEKHVWLSEGLSTYLEPISRAAIGALTPERIWHDMIEGMPQGLPEAGDKGLERTHTWGRTYWGGCLFCLLADVRIRERTDGHRSLQDALRAILDAGGDGSVEWPISRMLETGDRATGTVVLKELYEEMALKSKTIDLDALWKSLGIRADAEGVKFDDSALLAWVRKAITTARASR